MRNARARVCGWGLALLVAAGLAGCGPEPQAAPSSPARASPGPAIEAEAARFLERHWASPLAPQGPLPASMVAQGLTLSPQSCATCHAAQFEDWRQSLHSRAMGPGVLGQLLNMPAGAREDHQGCLRCHAPLAEQADSLVAAIGSPPQTRAQPAGEGEGAALHDQGLVCAGCHVRKGEWHGPPRRDGSGPVGDKNSAPHGGWKANAAFESSRFCAACHQFDKDGFALNGKLLENTFAEWQESRYAREGASCQSCHMPDRRHLWRGIHDPEMVKRGVEIRAGDATVANGQLVSQLTVANTGVGHFFPTYVTPRVVIRAFQQDAAGRELRGTEQKFVIAREVSHDLGREIADTRIAPDAKSVFEYRTPRHGGATDMVWQVEVQPDAFYFDVYESLLRGPLPDRSRLLIARARDNAKTSPYQLYAKQLHLP